MRCARPLIHAESTLAFNFLRRFGSRKAAATFRRRFGSRKAAAFLPRGYAPLDPRTEQASTSCSERACRASLWLRSVALLERLRRGLGMPWWARPPAGGL